MKMKTVLDLALLSAWVVVTVFFVQNKVNVIYTSVGVLGIVSTISRPIFEKINKFRGK